MEVKLLYKFAVPVAVPCVPSKLAHPLVLLSVVPNVTFVMSSSPELDAAEAQYNEKRS